MTKYYLYMFVINDGDADPRTNESIIKMGLVSGRGLRNAEGNVNNYAYFNLRDKYKNMTMKVKKVDSRKLDYYRKDIKNFMGDKYLELCIDKSLERGE